MSIRDFIAALPKTDLHLVGAASVPTVVQLARRYPQAGLPADADALARLYTFTDFAHFIDVYHAVDRLVQSPEDVTTLIVGAARDAAASNVRWAELTVTASTHLRAGMDPAALKDALEVGRALAYSEHGYEGLADIARTGARVSFAPEEVRRDLIAEINATLAGATKRRAASAHQP